MGGPDSDEVTDTDTVLNVFTTYNHSTGIRVADPVSVGAGPRRAIQNGPDSVQLRPVAENRIS